MNDNNLFIDFRFSKIKINNFLQDQLKQLYAHKITTEGFDVQLLAYEEESISISAKDKSIFATIPTKFTFTKSAGLFSIEGEGCLRVFMEITCDITENLVLSTQSKLLKHEWIQEPKLHVGELNIPVELLSNCIIGYMKEDMLKKLDQKIASDFDLNANIVSKLDAFGVNYLINKKPELYFNSQLLQIQMDVLREDAQDIHMHMWLELLSKISDVAVQFEQKSNPNFYWADNTAVKNLQKVDVELSYQGLGRVIMTELNGKEFGGKTFEIASINIRNTSFLEIKIQLREPIKGIITVTGIPKLDVTNQKLYVTNLQIDIDAENFIYKLSSPIIEKIIRSKLEALFPIDPLPLFAQFIHKIPTFNIMDNMISLKPQIESIQMEQLIFGNQSLLGTLVLNGAEVDIEV